MNTIVEQKSIQDPLIGEYAEIISSRYVSKSYLKEWELTCRFEKAPFTIRVFSETANRLKQAGLELQVGASQDFSKAPYLFVVGHDAKHNRRCIEAFVGAKGLVKLADLPSRPAPIVAPVTPSPAPAIAIVPTPQPAPELPMPLADKLALMEVLAREVLAELPNSLIAAQMVYHVGYLKTQTEKKVS